MPSGSFINKTREHTAGVHYFPFVFFPPFAFCFICSIACMQIRHKIKWENQNKTNKLIGRASGSRIQWHFSQQFLGTNLWQQKKRYVISLLSENRIGHHVKMVTAVKQFLLTKAVLQLNKPLLSTLATTASLLFSTVAPKKL